MKKNIILNIASLWLVLPFLLAGTESYAAQASDYRAIPPFISSGAPPLVMLVMGRNHKLYYEAYNDASDLNADGIIDYRYTPAIEYYGYFDSYKCYTYSSANTRFEPSARAPAKTCLGATEWSGDFLNYLTMSRMDTIRKVLYGGYRSTDSSTETILQRVYVPQDAHSWGKEYTSSGVDGYDIADYAPLSTPAGGTRHLFASTTLSENGDPILRVAPNNTHRIWEWVAKERPVVDDSIVTGAGGHPGHPNNHSEYEDLVTTFANAAYLQTPSLVPAGTTNINGGGPYGDNYMAIFTGTLNVTTAGTYSIAVDGDDAVEVIIDGGTNDEQVVGFYGSHGSCNCTTNNRSFALTAGAHTLEFRMEEAGGGDNYYLHWNGPDSGNIWQIIPAHATAGISNLTNNTYSLSSPASSITNYDVRVQVCDTSVALEANCQQYPDGNYKPVGILQRHGESGNMLFGLMSGSWGKNTSGGVLRRNIGDISTEIIADTGQFDSSVNGIINTINSFRIYGFDYDDNYTYNQDCGWIVDRPINEGDCRDWGNPIAEMMYETERYFAGLSSPTPDFDYIDTTDDTNLGLPKPLWSDPYDPTTGFPSCARPFMLVLSDINPTYDTDQLPGVHTNFGTGLTDDVGAPTALDVESLANTISTNEAIAGERYIGQVGAVEDGSCTVKTVNGFGDIRGLCPEEPTKLGGYYSASVAYHSHIQDINSSAADDQTITTYSVALASPLPKIELTIGSSPITLVPYAKSVGGYGISSDPADFQPTNTIVDFFIQELTPVYGRFRINYEDVEQGADHDMDAIIVYTYQLVDGVGNAVVDPANAVAVEISLDSTYAAGSIIQHCGYIISGTTADGTYLEVRDFDTDAGDDIDYHLDTPNIAGVALPLSTSRTFLPSNTGGDSAARLLENPLWYAAKWGSFEEDPVTANDIPDQADEWDEDGDGVPDTYYYVTNPLRLEQQLNASFASILNRASSGTAASVISNTRSGEGSIIQSVFFPEKVDSTPDANSVNWVGQVHALLVDAYGNLREDSDNDQTLDFVDDAIILFNNDGTVRRYEDTNGNQQLDTDERTVGDTNPNIDFDDLGYLWNTSDWLNRLDSNDTLDIAKITQQRPTYLSNEDNRYIITGIDADGNGAVDSSEVTDFVWPATAPTVAELATSGIYPYLHLYPSFADKPSAITLLSAADFETFLVQQTERQINYIRGLDYVDDHGTPEPLVIDGSDVPGTEMRSRKYDGRTWRLGDIVYSTPTLVGRPAEALHLLYRDTSYAAFAFKYHNRRNVIYSGANDGMVHAFNGGFFDEFSKQFCREIEAGYDPYDADLTNDIACDLTTTMPELGAELWGYVPFNILPHLYWLTQTTYDTDQHVYYVDQKPRIFDAKIFPEETACRSAVDSDGDGIMDLDLNNSGCNHPNRWGTVMVVGMRFGGGSIVADMDKTDGANVDADDPTMKSAFLIFDITNPEAEPILLAELIMPNMGFATSHPTVAVMKDGDHDRGLVPDATTNPVVGYEDYDDSNPELGENRWFLAFGSGPADSSGNPGTVDSPTGAYDNSILESAQSSQYARFYMLDLVKLASNNELYTLYNNGDLTPGLHSYLTLEHATDPALDDPNSFVSAPISVDYDLDYNTDVLYFGTISDERGDALTPDWGGKLRRIVIDDIHDGGDHDDMDPVNWDANNVLMDVGQPITAAPSVGLDDVGRNWVYFGTGRYFVEDDKTDLSLQSYYGIIEPMDSNNYKTWATVTRGVLTNVTNYQVFTDGTVSVDDGVTTEPFNDFEEFQDQDVNYKGWYLDFYADDLATIMEGERNLGQAALIGGLLSFTTFTPSDDVCEAGGESDLWALYYKTGTAYFSGVLGTTDGFGGAVGQDNRAKRSVGEGVDGILIRGLATSPNIHVGREEGSVVFVQSSTGEISRVEEENPLSTKSGVLSWKLR